MSNSLDLLAYVWTAQSALAIVFATIVFGWYMRNFMAAARLKDAFGVKNLWLMALGSITLILCVHVLLLTTGILSIVLEPDDPMRIFWSRILVILAQLFLLGVTIWKFGMTIKMDRELSEGVNDPSEGLEDRDDPNHDKILDEDI